MSSGGNFLLLASLVLVAVPSLQGLPNQMSPGGMFLPLATFVLTALTVSQGLPNQEGAADIRNKRDASQRAALHQSCLDHLDEFVLRKYDLPKMDKKLKTWKTNTKSLLDDVDVEKTSICASDEFTEATCTKFNEARDDLEKIKSLAGGETRDSLQKLREDTAAAFEKYRLACNELAP